MLRYGFFDSEITDFDEQGMPIFDRAESSDFLAMFISHIISSGVLGQPGDCFQVLAGEGMKLDVRPGFAVIQGRFAVDWNSSAVTLPVAPKLHKRIDRVVLRANYPQRLCELVVKEGIPAASPVPPELLQPESGDYYELCLATVHVNQNQSVITQANITDTRYDSSVCGVVTQVIDHLDTAVFFAQLNQFYSEFVGRSEASYNQFVVDMQTCLDALQASGDKKLQELNAQFQAWFEGIKDQITEDMAVKLQAELELHKTDSDVHTTSGKEYPKSVWKTDAEGIPGWRDDGFPKLAKAPDIDDDLNHYIEDGLWYFADNGKIRAHMPPGCVDGYLMVFQVDEKHIKHLFYRAGTKKINSWQIFERSYTYAGQNLYEWTDWTRTVTKADPEGRMLSGYLDPVNVTAPCWLRVAKFHNESPRDNNIDILGAAPYSCLISIKRSYNHMNTEEYLIRLDSKYQHARLSQMYGYGDSQLITDVRLVADTAAHELYLDIYYNYSNPNPILVSFMDANVHGGWWEALPFLVVAGSKADWTVLSNLKPKREFFLDLNILDAGNNTVLTFAYSKPGLGASEFPNGWLAAWNDRELRAIHWDTLKTIMELGNVENTNDEEKDVNSARYLKGWTDTRNVPTTPNDYNASFKIVGIKYKNAIGVTDGSMYATVAGIRGWIDSSAGKSHEFAFTASGNLYHRSGETTEWGEWRRIAWSNMIPTALSSFTNDLEKVKLVPESGSWIQGMQVNRAALAIKNAATTSAYYPALSMQLLGGHVGTIGMCADNFGLWGYLKGRTANGTDAALYFDFAAQEWKVGPVLAGTFKGNLTGNADTATALASNAGSATKPVYFSGGKPVACTYLLEKSVPSNAVFTDTNTWRPVQNNLTSTSATDALSAAQGRALANGSARDNTKLPLAGGKMTGALNMNGQQVNLASDAYIFAGANVFIGSSRANAVVQTRSAGGLAVLNATGASYVHVLASAFTVSSSRKVKEHIREMTEERARRVLEYQVVTFDYIGDGTPNDCDGMIAEDIAETYEYPVSRDCQGEIIGLDYSKFVPQLIKMVQMQEKRMDKLAEIIEDQRREIDALRGMLVN